MEKETEKFIKKTENKFKEGTISITEFESLLKEWGQLISVSCYENNTEKQTYLKLNHPKLTVQWYKQQNCNTHNDQFQEFLQYLIQYISIELQGLEMHPGTKENQHEIKEVPNKEIKWIAQKRSLIELICALDEAKCINSGNITTQRLVVLFGEFFDINLKNYHSEINKMALRKPLNNNGQHSYFLNSLVEKFNSKMHDLS